MQQNHDALAQILAQTVESEPAYAIGQSLIDRLAAEGGLTKEQAAERLLYAAPGGKEALCACAAHELVRLVGEGEDVDRYLADSTFVQMLLEMPATTALRLYKAEHTAQEDARRERELGAQDLLEKLMARSSLPSPIRGGVPATSERDYANMSSAQFAAVKKQLARAAQSRRLGH